MGKPKRIQVFVSSTQGDLRELHEQVVAVIEAFPLLECVTQHRFTAEVIDSATADAEKIAACGLVIFLLGHRYGSIAAGRDKSFVELEYEATIENEKDHLVFFFDENEVSTITAPPGQRNVDDGDDWQKLYDRQKALKRRATTSGGPQATPITARNLLPKVVAALFQWAERRRHRLVSAPARSRTRKGEPAPALLDAYRSDVRAAYEHLRLIGMPRTPGMPVRLEDLYVPMLAIERRLPSGRSQSRREPMANDAPTLPLNLVFANGTRRAFVLLGLPGSGKTTYLRTLALACAAGKPPPGLPADTVPVYLPLRELRAEEVDVGFEHLLARHHQRSGSDDLDVYRWLLQQRRNVLFLFDGLDELPRTLRARVARRIEALANREGAWIGVSSRVTGYVDDARLVGDFLELEVQPFDPPAADDFIGRWFQAVDRGDTNDRADGLRRHLADACTKHIRLNELRANPLQLTILCLVWRDRGEALSTERADLYRECLQVLLDRWRLAGIVVQWSASQALAVLQPLARHLHEQHAARLSRTDLIPVVAEALAAGGMSATSDEFLAELGEESGVFVAHGNDEFGFLHLGFQEYLTARDIQGRTVRAALAGQPLEPLAQLVQRLLGPGPEGHTVQRWWLEVAELLVALDGAPMFAPLVRTALAQPGWPALEATMRDWVRIARERDATPLLEATKDKRRSPGARGVAAELAAAAGALASPATIAHSLPIGASGSRSRAGIELVAIERGERTFWFARTCVTNAQYRAFTEATGHTPPQSWRNSKFNGDDQPVVEVSWHDAEAFCKWAGLRLPTDEEWEFACRAGTSTNYWSGDDESDLERVGWYDKNSGGKTQPVGMKPANPFGLFDMHGNVWEWCQDEYDGPDSRVLRGGSWFIHAGGCRSAHRYAYSPGYRLDDVGFRPASSSP